jgi:SAM-dependent methyltransferase
MLLLNLGCGAKTSDRSDVVNIDWSIYLRIRSNWLLSRLARIAITGERRHRLDSLPKSIVVHDLSRGIPYPTNSADAVYHSHFLEHLDRHTARGFLGEVLRVLKPGGIQRIVVPDMEANCRSYLAHLDACVAGGGNRSAHDDYMGLLIEQSVRKEADGTSRQGPLRRKIENLVLGDARARGETHQWMYDRVNLTALLEELGYRDVTVRSYRDSAIGDWDSYGLDLSENRTEYIPGSLYVEARKP